MSIWRFRPITNACFDLWAKARGVPLWNLLLSLSPEQIVQTLNLRYVDDVLSKDDALEILTAEYHSRELREGILAQGYPGYDTSIGWFQYSDDTIKENIIKSMDQGFDAVKLKVGSADPDRDIRRAHLVRDTVGDDVRVMVGCQPAVDTATSYSYLPEAR